MGNLNHIIDWQEMVYKRIHGIETPSTGNNCFYEVTDTSFSPWTNTLIRLKQSAEKWQNFLRGFTDPDYKRIINLLTFQITD